mgnify:CR=1 FL=1
MSIHISTGNSKLGKIANISLPPGKACGKGVPCFACGKCYALKAARQYPGTRKAWGDNLAAWRRSPSKYFTDIDAWITKHRPKYFRWHVAGDFQDQVYVQRVADMAFAHPGTEFLAYTKRHDLRMPWHTDNLTIIRSMWPGWGATNGWTGPCAWMQDNTEDRVPKNAFVCPGKCGPCEYKCWGGLEGRDVVFNIH